MSLFAASFSKGFSSEAQAYLTKVIQSSMTFSKFGLDQEILSALDTLELTAPTSIQEQAIPEILQGHDLIATAQTGSGKTAAFCLPILQALKSGEKAKPNHVRCLIIAPTRELAIQLNANIKAFNEHLTLRHQVIFGGVRVLPQRKYLKRGSDILVATPGRLLDLHQRGDILFDSLTHLVLDEADRLLDLGFAKELDQIIQALPKQRQTLLFSATFAPPIKKLAKKILNQPKDVTTIQKAAAKPNINQWLHPVDKKRKTELLLELLNRKAHAQVIVFTNTKKNADLVAQALNQDGISAGALHSDRTQDERIHVFDQFKNNEISILVATDVAARGIDIQNLPLVINYDLPKVSEDYIHRIGRTGRAGHAGQAFSIASADEFDALLDIEALTGKKITRKYIDGFHPDHDIPLQRKAKAKPTKSKKDAKKTAEKKPTLADKPNDGLRSNPFAVRKKK
ncbi:DEAD/DEAH box helicase [Marinomonas mediterranea]|nr:DEAD/DEAH box helicase [Marinomonas mediterranea]